MVTRERPQSEVQATNFFACGEDCGEVFGDKFEALFSEPFAIGPVQFS